MKKTVSVFGVSLLILFNLYLYSAEFTALVDPNDNIFQYALIDEARNIWQNIFAGKLSPMYLLDSWNERWAEGFALTSNYAHLPQAILGLFGGYKLFVIVRTLMLISLPLMFFFGSRILGLGLFQSFIVSLLSQTIFTDGLYGIDVTSYMWRGWGLSAQLMAVFFLPVAFGYTIRYLDPPSHEATAGRERNLGKAILFNFLVASSHFGIFSLILLGYGLYWPFNISSWENFKYQILNLRSKTQRSKLKETIFPSLILVGAILFSVAYFIIPFFFQSDYRNYSVWDPIWKFDSWGLKQVLIWFFNGDLFDFNRLPIITIAVLFGLFVAIAGKNKSMRYFGVLFIFYFLLFLGRATFGGAMNLIPGFSEYHQHRVIVMVQFAGIYIASWFIYKFVKNVQLTVLNFQSIFKLKIVNSAYILGFILGFVLLYHLEKPLIDYAKDNATWLQRANQAYLTDLPDYEKIKTRLANLPRARVYVGRPGNWGKQFTVGETPLYMVLSRDGYPTIGFLPESWSMNSDPEQFFNENDINFYNLYNIGYSILPNNINPPEFADLIAKEGKYNLYEIKTDGWFTAATSSIAVNTEKTNLINPTRLWFESDSFKQGDYPKIDLSKSKPDGMLWHIQMTDKNNWINLNDNKERNLWQANPFSVDLGSSSSEAISIKNQQILTNGYKAQVEVQNDCKNCIVVLKQSFHPNWQVTINGLKAKTNPVFPFYIGIPAEKAGSFDVVAEYKPSWLKSLLLCAELIGFGLLIWAYRRLKLPT